MLKEVSADPGYEELRDTTRPEVPIFFDNSEFLQLGLPLRDYALTKEIALTHQPFVYNDISPTPLDPFSVRAQDFPYYEGASMYMHSNIIEKSNQIHLPAHFESVVASEVDFQHAHRSERNSETFELLVKHLPYDISPYEAERLMRVRAGVGRSHEPAQVLAMLSKIKNEEVKKKKGGLEGMKATRICDYEALLLADAQFVHDLHVADKNEQSFTIDHLYTMQNAQTISLRDLRPKVNGELPEGYVPTYADAIAVVKWVQAELTVSGVAIEAVSRNSYICLPPSLKLDGVEPNIVTRQGGVKVNLQPLDITKYYRLKKEEVADRYVQ